MKLAIAIAIVAAIALGVWWWRDGHGQSTPATSTSAERPVGPSAVASQPPPQARDQRELDDVAQIVRDLALSDEAAAEVTAAMKELQDGRRKLFDDLAAKKINAEQVSRGLHELRARMHVRIEAALGADHARAVLDKIRDDHR